MASIVLLHYFFLMFSFQVKFVIFPFIIGYHFLLLRFCYFFAISCSRGQTIVLERNIFALSWKSYLIILVQLFFSTVHYCCNNFFSLIFMATVLFVGGCGCSTTLFPAINFLIFFMLQRQHFNCKITHAKIVTFWEIVLSFCRTL